MEMFVRLAILVSKLFQISHHFSISIILLSQIVDALLKNISQFSEHDNCSYCPVPSYSCSLLLDINCHLVEEFTHYLHIQAFHFPCINLPKDRHHSPNNLRSVLAPRT